MIAQYIEKGLVLGASGLVGRSLFDSLKRSGIPTLGFRHRSLPNSEFKSLNIVDFQAVKNKLQIERPSHVFHCANRPGGVDSCETQPDEAKLFHLDATRNLARICREIDAIFVFISTDYVFGNYDHAASESDPTIPLNVYGRLKREAEQVIQAETLRSILIRTTNVYGWDPETNTPNYSMQVLRDLGKKGGHIANGALATPTYVEDIIAGLYLLLEQGLFGIYHCVGPEVLSRYQWAQLIGQTFGYHTNAITLTENNHAATAVIRPKVQLSTRKILDAGFLGFKSPEEGVKTMYRLANQPSNRDSSIE